ncbi:hypothetical protein SAMN05421642_105340 [Rhodococcoides kyotonense]|uniref:Uncharacterized protein n=1 Tax=Rhodococcoides kyotonense TaxID=398843 RepID=A0A239HM35_9NOCA|nr:hypothetical protein [Rhodococcus kyotonensis]SNS82449.1 hypothetical protein SAMN05421642_105340 [Rhodococcus kyotonensis]
MSDAGGGVLTAFQVRVARLFFLLPAGEGFLVAGADYPESGFAIRSIHSQVIQPSRRRAGIVVVEDLAVVMHEPTGYCGWIEAITNDQ